MEDIEWVNEEARGHFYGKHKVVYLCSVQPEAAKVTERANYELQLLLRS